MDWILEKALLPYEYGDLPNNLFWLYNLSMCHYKGISLWIVFHQHHTGNSFNIRFDLHQQAQPKVGGGKHESRRFKSYNAYRLAI